jgi:two-component system nitrate/nitrite response regulator NarL
MTEAPIRVLLVDDHLLFRKGIASLLSAEEGFEVVGEAADGVEAVEKASVLMPDVILMDLNMPQMTGLETTRRIKEALPYTRIVMLTISEEEQDLFEAVKVGAQGYLLKKIEPKALFSTIRAVMRGEASFSRAMATKLLREFARRANRTAASPAESADLTAREKEVLGLVAHGKSNKEIAATLDVAENTVKNHLKNILEKLHLENRVQAAMFALKSGIVPPPKPS